jgi:hypothetical protein
MPITETRDKIFVLLDQECYGSRGLEEAVDVQAKKFRLHVTGVAQL